MNTEIAKALSESIDVLSKKLGVAAEYLYSTLLKQVYVEAVDNLVWFLILGAVAALCGWITKFSWKRFNADSEEWVIAFALALAAAIMFSLVSIYDLTSGIKMLINPDYYVIKGIISAIPK